MSILSEAFIYGVVNNFEVWRELLLYNKRAAFCEDKSMRRRVGYIFFVIGFWPIAKRLIRY